MNSISSVNSSMMQYMYGSQKPDADEMAQQLFSKLDSSGQGYIEKSDLQSAFSKISSTSESDDVNTDESDLDELFSKLDSDGNGKITEDEFTNSLIQIEEQISNLFSQMRMNEAQEQMMPPPPPPKGDRMGEDIGFTEEELTAQLEAIGDSDSDRSTLIQNILTNFEAADTDGDGRVNLEEAMAFKQESGSSNSDSNTATSTQESDLQSDNGTVMLQIVRLMEAYGLGSGDITPSTLNIST